MIWSRLTENLIRAYFWTTLQYKPMLADPRPVELWVIGACHCTWYSAHIAEMAPLVVEFVTCVFFVPLRKRYPICVSSSLFIIIPSTWIRQHRRLGDAAPWRLLCPHPAVPIWCDIAYAQSFSLYCTFFLSTVYSATSQELLELHILCRTAR